MTAGEPTRAIMWNISHAWLMYALFAVALAIAGLGILRRVQTWRRGQPAHGFDRPRARVRRLLVHALGQRRTLRVPDAGLMHAGISVGFFVLTVATTVVLVEYDLGLPVMRGAFYLYFQSFAVDVFGALVIAGVAVAAFRRRPGTPAPLVRDRESWLLLALLGVVCLGGFFVEGWRIAATADPWGPWSPFGYAIARVSVARVSAETLATWHLAGWWAHVVTAFGLLAWAPYTKLIHVVTAPLNIYAAPLVPVGAFFKPVDFETTAPLGVADLAGFTWKDLLDLDACIACGRCTAACPAHRVGKVLSPRDLILDLGALMHAWARPRSTGPSEAGAPAGPAVTDATPALGGEALWACTTCAACVEVCPVFVDQRSKIVDMRRYRAMELANVPAQLQTALRSLESRGHPFAGAQVTRMAWADGLGICEASSGADATTLLWVGCAGALLERNHTAVRATARLLQRAGVDFAVLGPEEKCTGDPARWMGQQFLFEQLARANIATFVRYGVKRIITACPHCYNTLRHDYPRMGSACEVVHHSEVLAELVDQGRLPAPTVAGAATTLHDPCFLGRQNGVFAAPRRLVGHAMGRPVVEMAEHHESSFCCGGGGGLSFVEEPPATRVNRERARQALATGADVVATACPFCLTMMEDATGAMRGDRHVRVADVAELLWEAVGDGRA